MESNELENYTNCANCGGLFLIEKMDLIESQLVSDGVYGLEFAEKYLCIHCQALKRDYNHAREIRKQKRIKKPMTDLVAEYNYQNKIGT